MEKLFVYDLETTGVQFWKHGIHQISGMIIIDGKFKEEFNFKVAPHPKAIIEDEALAVGGITKEQLLYYPPQLTVYKELIKVLSKYVDKFNKKDKFHLMGYNNASFDNQFFRAFFTQCEDKYFGSWFWSDTIDVMVLASNKLRHERSNMVDFKLKTVSAYLGIEVDETKLHDALYDIQLTKEVYDVVSKPVKIASAK